MKDIEETNVEKPFVFEKRRVRMPTKAKKKKKGAN
jgi:hypothetical protein